MKTYTGNDIDSIIQQHGWIPTLCKNEKNGKDCNGIDTIQLSFDGEEDYFGEFLQTEPIKDEFTFRFYV